MSRAHHPNGRTVAVASLATVLVIGITACAGGDDAPGASSPLDSIVPVAPSVVPVFQAADDAPVARPAATPAEAVERYLAAEVAGDVAGSYASLSAASRGVIGSLEDWADGALGRPTVVGYEIEAPSTVSGASTAIVRADVRYEPRLDEVVGFVPGRATVDWFVTAEQGGWLVDVAAAAVTPVLPDDGGASRAAMAWVQEKQACRDGAANEYGGSLLGSPAVGDALCGVGVALSAGPVAAVGDAMASSTVAAFGPGARTWARTVPITGGPEPISVVTAPLGDQWLVVGVGR